MIVGLSGCSSEDTCPYRRGMTTSDTERRSYPLKFFTTLLHLVTMGVFGVAVLTVIVTLLATGISLVPVVGIGLLLLIAVVYCMYAIAWCEVERVSWLYALDVPALRLHPRGDGFKGYLGSLWRQFIDARMWRAIANFTIATVLGFIALVFVQAAVRIGMGLIVGTTVNANVFRPLGFTIREGGSIAFAIASLIAIPIVLVLITMLHRTVGVALIEAGTQREELQAQVRVTTQQREGAVRAAEVERTRIERDLHDGVQPRLVSIAMTLGLAQEMLDTDPAAAKSLIVEAHTSTKAAVTELRQLARGIHASVLDDRGLDAALSALASRSHIPVHIDSRLNGTPLAREAETAVYFAVAESLTNAAKHSLASEVRVSVRVRETPGADPLLWARIEDNGVGGAIVQPGGGLDGIMNRITAAGGSTRLESPAGGPTTLEVSVPCAS